MLQAPRPPVSRTGGAAGFAQAGKRPQRNPVAFKTQQRRRDRRPSARVLRLGAAI